MAYAVFTNFCDCSRRLPKHRKILLVTVTFKMVHKIIDVDKQNDYVDKRLAEIIDDYSPNQFIFAKEFHLDGTIHLHGFVSVQDCRFWTKIEQPKFKRLGFCKFDLPGGKKKGYKFIQTPSQALEQWAKYCAKGNEEVSTILHNPIVNTMCTHPIFKMYA